MKILKIALNFAVLTLTIFSVFPTRAADQPSAQTTAEGTTITLPNGQTFNLPPGKGLLGPSSNPSSQVPFTNAEGTVVAVNEQPATKTSFVHIYLKGSSGKFTEIKNVNQAIRKAIPASVHTLSTEFIRVEYLEHRVLDVETVYDFSTNPSKRQTFKIRVSSDGAISTTR